MRSRLTTCGRATLGLTAVAIGSLIAACSRLPRPNAPEVLSARKDLVRRCFASGTPTDDASVARVRACLAEGLPRVGEPEAAATSCQLWTSRGSRYEGEWVPLQCDAALSCVGCGDVKDWCVAVRPASRGASAAITHKVELTPEGVLSSKEALSSGCYLALPQREKDRADRATSAKREELLVEVQRRVEAIKSEEYGYPPDVVLKLFDELDVALRAAEAGGASDPMSEKAVEFRSSLAVFRSALDKDKAQLTLAGQAYQERSAACTRTRAELVASNKPKREAIARKLEQAEAQRSQCQERSRSTQNDCEDGCVKARYACWKATLYGTHAREACETKETACKERCEEAGEQRCAAKEAPVATAQAALRENDTAVGAAVPTTEPCAGATARETAANLSQVEAQKTRVDARAAVMGVLQRRFGWVPSRR